MGEVVAMRAAEAARLGGGGATSETDATVRGRRAGDGGSRAQTAGTRAKIAATLRAQCAGKPPAAATAANVRRMAAERAARGAALEIERTRDTEGWSGARRKQFLAALAETGNAAGSARAVGMATSGLYTLRGRDKRFAAAWADAVAQYNNELEANLIRRVIEGTEKPLLYRGKVVTHERVYSDRLAELMMKRVRPEAAVEVRSAAEAMAVAGRAGEKARLMLEARLAELATRMGHVLD